jgi:hypothetical protein
VGALGRIINATLVSSLFPIFVSESGCPGPHGSPLVSQYALSAVKRMIFTSRCLPFVSYLSPSTLWMLWACFLLFSHYALGALGRMILHLSPTCLLLVSYLSPACVLVRSGCFAPHDFFPQTVLGGSTFIGLRSWVTSPVCCWCPGVSRFYPCVPLVACLTLCVILHLSPACLALWACWAA